jgi:hypothetical protein
MINEVFSHNFSIGSHSELPFITKFFMTIKVNKGVIIYVFHSLFLILK